MELSVFERITLLNILPKQRNFATLIILRKLREDLSFDEAENKALDFQIKKNGLVKWRTEADKPKEVEMGEKAFEIIVETLKRLDERELLTDQHYSLYCKFIGDE